MPGAVLCLLLSALIIKTGESLDPTYSKVREETLTGEVSCKISDLDVDLSENTISCFPDQAVGGTVEDNAKCVIRKNVPNNPYTKGHDMVLKVCLHGIWTHASLGEKKDIHKRWFDWFHTSVVTTCPHLCAASSTAGEVVKSPPSFTNPCRPSSLLTTYYATAGQTGAIVTWSDPSAQDSDGAIDSVTQTEGSASGSLFTGSTGSGTGHNITYIVTDSDGLRASCQFTFTVIISTCSSAPWPSNGQRTCNQDANLGSVCTYSCNQGYELSGTSQATCQGSSSPSWTSTPTCEKISCSSTPPSVVNGAVSCTGHKYKSSCHISCDIGYALSGTGYTQCQADGSWSSVASTSCSDAPPEISCLTPQIFYADRHSNSTSPLLTVPTAIDAVDPNPTVTQTDGQAYGSTFQTGSAYVKYKATDNIGLESEECTIEIRVIETTCSDPAETLQNAHMAFSCTSDTYTYGTECTLSCNSNYPSVGTDRIICERNDSSDAAVGSWSWGSGTMPSCNDSDCPALDPPAHGTINMGYIGTSKIYSMVCDDNYTIPHLPNSFSGQFICEASGNYKPSIEVPDCVESNTASVMILPGEIYYGTGDCTDTTGIQSTLQQVIDVSVNPAIQTLCPTVNNCTVTDIRLTCSTSRKRRGEPSLREDRHYDEPYRYKRQSSSTLVVDFYIRAHVDTSLSQPTDGTDAADHALENIAKAYIEDLVNNGTFNIDTFTLQSDAFQTPAFGDLYCLEHGHLLRAASCAPCPPAYFHNTTSNECELCPVGSYSGSAASTSCTACQSGYTTLNTGSKSNSQCIEQCPAGRYSSTGTVPCTLCPVGYYQSGTGQTSCIKCTTGTTEFTGSVSSTVCQAFQVFVNDTGGVVTVGSISTDMTHISLLFWTKLYANMAPDAYIKLTSGGDDRIIISLTSTIRVEMPGTTFNKTIGSLSSSDWSHVAVTWDTDNNDVLAFINGPLHSSETFVTPPSSPLVSGGTIQIQSTGSTGIYIADFHVEDAVLTPSEISSMLSTCWTQRSGDVFNLDNFRDSNLQSVAIQSPMACDPINECASNPCNDHTCVNGINTYTCYCSGGWSGTTCTTPPDYCVNHACANGATCVNGTNGYTCTCVAGYSAELCDIPPANGDWSVWSDWSVCTVTCSGGTQTRTRSCDSPAAETNGADCSGVSSETQACNQNSCPACPSIIRSNRVMDTCVTDGATGATICQIHCTDGYAIPDNLADDEFACGINTDYTWQPMGNLPDCVEPEKPPGLQIMSQIRFVETVTTSDIPAVKQAILDNMSATLPCMVSGICSASVDITDSKRKRSTGSRLTVTLVVVLTDTGAMNIQNYIATATASTSFQELIDAINSLENSASYISSSSSSLFDVTVNGVTYSSSQSTLTFTGNVTCPSGQTVANGVCAPCPAGTYDTSGHCTYCEKGTYSSSTGQTSCTPCPSGLSTTTIGSYAASQCTVDMTTTTTTDTTSTQGSMASNINIKRISRDNTALHVGVALAAVAMVFSISACAIVMYKKKTKKGRRVNSATTDRQPPHVTRDHTSVSMTDIEYVDGPNVFTNPLYDGDRVRPACGTPNGNKQPMNQSFRGTKFVDLPNTTHDGNVDYVRPAVSPPPPYDQDMVLPGT